MASTEGSTDSESTTHAEGTDTVAVLPVVADLTYNEVHSMELGLVGLLAGVGFQAGYREVVAAFTIAVVGAAFGLRYLSGDRLSVARRVIRREPWYFLTVYVLTAVGAGLAWELV